MPIGIRVYAKIIGAFNRLENTFGFDLDGDGGVGKEGGTKKVRDTKKTKGSNLLQRTVLNGEWGKQVHLHWKTRFYFALTTWLCFATLILTSRCMQAS